MFVMIPPVFASSDALWDMLAQSREQAQNLSYEGLLVSHSNGFSQSSRLFHQRSEQGEFELLEHLDGPTKRWIRLNQDIQCVVPDRKQIFLEKRPSSMMTFPYFPLFEAKAHLKSIYSIHEFSSKRVAGRETRVVHLLPKDQYRYQYRFYLDKQRQFLLRSEILSEHDRVLEQVGFTDISFDVGPLPKPSLLSTEQGWQVSSTELSPLKASDLPYQFPDDLLGFKRVNQFCRSKDKDKKVNQFIFSDGLSTVSVFVRKAGADADVQPLSLSHGAVMFKSTIYEGYVVTAMGEVPERTLNLFLRSIQWTSR